MYSERILAEDERIPSFMALWRHWMRATYTCICIMWANASLSDPYFNLPLPENSGWILNADGTYSIDWEDAEKQSIENVKLS